MHDNGMMCSSCFNKPFALPSLFWSGNILASKCEMPYNVLLSHANNAVIHGFDDDCASGGEFRADEATGLLTLRVRSGRYSVVAVIQVPDGYPIEGCGVELKSHNFPAHIARHHLVQVALPTACGSGGDGIRWWW